MKEAWMISLRSVHAIKLYANEVCAHKARKYNFECYLCRRGGRMEIGMKNSRHTRILEIIGDYVIETQDDLIEKLKESGYPVTQATVSRDIKQLGLIKTATKNGGYKYTVARSENSSNENKLKNIMRETVVNAQDAQNIIVVKTFPGMANAAAAALDSLVGEAVIGSIAGDDTIFIVVRNAEDASEFTNFIKEIIGC